MHHNGPPKDWLKKQRVCVLGDSAIPVLYVLALRLHCIAILLRCVESLTSRNFLWSRKVRSQIVKNFTVFKHEFSEESFVCCGAVRGRGGGGGGGGGEGRQGAEGTMSIHAVWPCRLTLTLWCDTAGYIYTRCTPPRLQYPQPQVEDETSELSLPSSHLSAPCGNIFYKTHHLKSTMELSTTTGSIGSRAGTEIDMMFVCDFRRSFPFLI